MITGIEKYMGPEKSAVLVIDMQNDFCHPQGFWGKENLNLAAMDEMVLRLKGFVGEARVRP